ncbi:hypothetical protein BJ978_002479 [Agromyces terreus]|uniref:Uncharacterized protein n=1 Tax=Agromyces terreus TaxID=424795 RepID=A0A9X2H2K7_9MICO|nr:hypothetical protein [Agromyces terreus]
MHEKILISPRSVEVWPAVREALKAQSAPIGHGFKSRPPYRIST